MHILVQNGMHSVVNWES